MNYIQQQEIPTAAPPPPLPQQQQQGLTAEQPQYSLVVLKQEQALKSAQQKRDFKDRRSRVRDMLDHQNRRTPVVINSLDEYLAMDAAYRSLSNCDKEEEKKIPTSIEGFPMTDADRAALVAQLSAAIMDFSNIVDKPMKRATKRNAPVANSAVKAVKALSTFEVQLLAWKILCAICDAHCGLHNVPSWTNVWKYNSYDSFTARFRDVRHAVTRCKALLKSILDTDIPFVKRLAAGPRAEFRMKRENSEINDKRAAEREESKKRKPDDAGLDGEEGDALPDPGGQATLPGHQKDQIPTADYASESNAIRGVPNGLIFRSDDGIMHSHDGNISTGGNEILDNALDSPSVGGQASSLDFGVDQSGGMDGATNNEPPMHLSAHHDHAFAQASTELGDEGFGSQASGFQPAAGDFEVNTSIHSGPRNPAGLQHWDFSDPGGYDAEHDNLLDAFDLIRELSPGLQLTLATLGDSMETQQQDQFPSAVTQSEDSLNTGPGEFVQAEPTSTSQSPHDQIEHDRLFSGEED
ncbi:hypothetical protein INS49_004914 [Diaporthe citri]|uniref:uncharacterized protein n=1 Tax=Diaporthe citri TaxID=83186 RepID=UPI001C814473|nr:uncharacterized protein INS49_004914 [Diaporthe citri]KAG6354309.1 hypothetical protein INS49_004914 [Diaporthe citri]